MRVLSLMTYFIIFILTASSVLAQECSTEGGGQEGSQGSGGGKGKKPPGKGPGKDVKIPVVGSRDPNDITGSRGYAVKHWVSVKDKLNYTIRFENDPKFATAPAQNVYVYLPVDPKININSLSVGTFGFGNYTFRVPEDLTFYSTRLDVQDSLGLYVDFIAGIDITKHQLFWIFKSIDPKTGQAPANALSGFLPVNDTSINRYNETLPKGEGFVSFLINPQKTLATGDTVTAKAVIIFDTNEEIPTNTWVNSIDAVAPTSKINSHTVNKDSIILNWSGHDDSTGTGVRDYALYVSDNGGVFTLYKDKIEETYASFAGTPGGTYSFFTLATDNTGNREAIKTAGDQTVLISSTGIFVSVKAFLQGPYNIATGFMADSLRAKALLPTADPYPSLGFTAVNNISITLINAGLLDSTGNKAITDWVWLELRNSTNPAQVIATRPALIRRDGNVVDMDGSSPVYFNGVAEGIYYVALRHRNHLGVMTAGALALKGDATTAIDFTSPSTSTYGTEALNNQSGVMVMWAGDANGDKRVRYNGQANDKNAVLLKVGLSTSNNILTIYNRADVNMDGKVRYNGMANDKNFILSVLGLSAPNRVITEQIPNQ